MDYRQPHVGLQYFSSMFCFFHSDCILSIYYISGGGGESPNRHQLSSLTFESCHLTQRFAASKILTMRILPEGGVAFSALRVDFLWRVRRSTIQGSSFEMRKQTKRGKVTRPGLASQSAPRLGREHKDSQIMGISPYPQTKATGLLPAT